MDSGHVPDVTELRALPRAFFAGASPTEAFELPPEELDKFRKVLRLGTGDPIAVLPNDGSLIVCRLDGRRAIRLQTVHPESEAKLSLTVAQALPKGDKLDEIVRACTWIGVTKFVLFHSDRTVVRWDDEKLAGPVFADWRPSPGKRGKSHFEFDSPRSPWSTILPVCSRLDPMP